MKSITLSALLFVTSAFASCPDLSGSYPTCRAVVGNGLMSTYSDVTITQENNTFHFRYTLNFENRLSFDTEKDIIADGKTLTLPLPWDEAQTYQVTTVCNRNRLLQLISLPERTYTVVYEKQGDALVVSNYGRERLDTQSICE